MRMCSNPQDPYDPGVSSIIHFSSGGFGYNPQTALANLSGTITDLSEVVVSPTSLSGVDVVEFPQISLADVLVSIVSLPQNVSFVNLPSSDQLKWNSNNPTFGRQPNVDMKELHDQAFNLAVSLWYKYWTDGKEWGAGIYVTANGTLHQTAPVTTGHTDSIRGGKLQIPAGAVLVLWMHTHPYTPGVDQRRPSTSGSFNDLRFLNEAIGLGRMDTNALAYIVADTRVDGNRVMAVHGYDMNTITGSGIGPELTGTPYWP